MSGELSEEEEFLRYKLIYEELKSRVQRLVSQVDVFSQTEVFARPTPCGRCGEIFQALPDQDWCPSCREREGR
jgi:hypothetical protein